MKLFSKKAKESLKTKMSDILLDFILCAKDKFKNTIINLTDKCLNSDCVDGYSMGMFLFWYYTLTILIMTFLIMTLLIMTMPVILDAAE
jgi:hypothetical protein